MRKLTLLTSGIALCTASMAMANDDLVAKMNDSKQWVIQTGDYKNQRYSALDQINADNVDDLQVAWTFSTGVLRGHEGSPLVEIRAAPGSGRDPGDVL
jgi:glucose dehydrogenase